MSTLAPTLLEIRAMDLQPGDTIVAQDAISLRVTSVRNPVFGFTVFGYEVSFGAGARTLASGQRITVIRSESEAH